MEATRRRVLARMTAGAGLLCFGHDILEAQAQPASSEREAATGIGGFFFRAQNPKLLAAWYQQHLGIALTPQSYNDPVWTQEAGPTIVTPFPQDTGYFGDGAKSWLINFRVRNLEKLALQLEAAGIRVKRDPESYPNGRFARIHDPEGNPIELWQPAGIALRK